MREDDPLQRRKTQAIAAVFGINLVFGMLLVALYPDLAINPENAQQALASLRGSGINLVYEVAILAACFGWLHFDSRQLDIRRPWWLNVGIILLTSVFVPYYLYKTRPSGRRGPAILAFFGIAFGALIAMTIGMFVALAMHGGPAATAPVG